MTIVLLGILGSLIKSKIVLHLEKAIQNGCSKTVINCAVKHLVNTDQLLPLFTLISCLRRTARFEVRLQSSLGYSDSAEVWYDPVTGVSHVSASECADNKALVSTFTISILFPLILYLRFIVESF